MHLNWWFHVLLVPALAIFATVTAELVPNYTIILSILFILIATWITIVPFVRPWLHSRTVSLQLPVDGLTPVAGVLKNVLTLHVFFYTIYGTMSLAAPGASSVTVFLWLDWLVSLAAYYALARETSVVGISPELHIPATPEAAETSAQTVQHIPIVQVTFPRLNMFLSRF